jgi:2,3-bisphosphoglycerate-independent phosphoglycerate mutase
MNAPVMLIILDGYGLGDGGDADASALAHDPFLATAREKYPHAQVETSGEAVGLPAGQMGNSEVGHMTIGAGRIIDQDLTRISRALAAGDLERNDAIQSTLTRVEQSGGCLHLIGLVSDGGVHSHLDHLTTILAACGARGIPTAVHASLDGRDTPQKSALGYLRELQPQLDAAGAKLATVIGRYYAMDRDQRWDRVGRAYDAIVCREGRTARTGIEAVESAYARKETDEFVEPTLIEGGPALADRDAVFFFNFRSDRARELTNLLSGVLPDQFRGAFEPRKPPNLSAFLCMTEYSKDFALPIAFPSVRATEILGEVLSRAGHHQLRVAETEKYAHVTFFFNSGVEEPFPGERRILVPSPRDVPTYDHKPEMSALEVTNAILTETAANDYSFVLVNFANPDMVGHTGDLSAAVKAVETIDTCLSRVAAACLEAGGHLLITADHGNCELMIDPVSGEPHTAHTTNPVPIYWISRDTQGRGLRNGGLADIAPTVLTLMGLPIPASMQGTSLIQ